MPLHFGILVGKPPSDPTCRILEPPGNFIEKMGLRSSANRLVETEGEGGMSDEKVDCSTEEKACELSNEKDGVFIGSGIEEVAVAPHRQEDNKGVDEGDGAKVEECSGKNHIGENGVVEVVDYDCRKRGRVDVGGESEDGGHLLKKAKDEILGRELEGVVGRVLRSGTVVRVGGVDTGGKGRVRGVVVGKEFKQGNIFENRNVKVKQEEGIDCDSEDGDGRGKNIKRKRGRPPKSQEKNGSERKSFFGKKEENDQYAGEDGMAKMKRKEEGNDCDAKDRLGPNDKQRKKLKRKRGRPPKSQGNNRHEMKRVEVEKEESDQCASEDGKAEVKREEGNHCDGKDSHGANNKQRKKLKRKRGRPLKSQGNNRHEMKRVEVEKEEGDQSAGEDGKAEVKREEGNDCNCNDSYEVNDKQRKKLKRKRGRPPKSQGNNRNETVEVEKVVKEEHNLSACENREKSENMGSAEIKSKLGRTPESQKDDVSGRKTIKMQKEGTDFRTDEQRNNVGGLRRRERGTKSGHSENHDVVRSSLFSRKRIPAKVPDMELVADKKIKCRSDKNDSGKAKAKMGEMRLKAEKQAVRDKIVKLVLDAGWTIDYRPRRGRNYMDAVYVNPEGKTHWSVTLAYRMLKEHYEKGGENAKTCKEGFKFIPLPQDEINILKKEISKVRCDKNKKRKKKRGGEMAKLVCKKQKKKQKLHRKKLGNAVSLGHKMLTGKMKVKYLPSKQSASASMSKRGEAAPVGDRKRLETHDRRRCALMVRKSKDSAESDGDGYVLYNGKRSVLTWMLDLGTVPLDGKVQYLKRRKARAMVKGRITTDGIQCDCCSQTFTVSEFEIHAGSRSCEPHRNIYLENGPSLLQCQLDSWNKQDESATKGFHFIDTNGEDPNDDTCGVCGDGGDLICCDGCPSTFHQSCLGIKMFPPGVWHCIYCSCKFCGMACGESFQRGDNHEAATSSTLLTCCLCEEKYHHSCVWDGAIDGAQSDPTNQSFCGKKCHELYERLQKLLGIKHEMGEGYSWSLVRRFEVGSDSTISGMAQKVECNSKVAVAMYVMDECFQPLVDHRSGVNLIRNIMYNFGSNFHRLNYIGFLTAILEKEEEIIAAASVRIHGNHLAEMPFIGTRYMYRRQGMCRRLLTGIETALSSLNVENLVIPAISEMTDTWTSNFGFKPVEEVSKQRMRNMNMMVFPGVDMLQKQILKREVVNEHCTPAEGLHSNKIKECEFMDETSNPDDGSSALHELKLTDGATSAQGGMGDGEPGVMPLSDGCLIDASDITGKSAELLVCPNARSPGEPGFVLDNLSRNRSVASPLVSTYDACEQNGEITKIQNAVSSSLVTHANETMLESYGQMEQHVSEACHNGSEAGGGASLFASREDTEVAACVVKMEAENIEDDINSHDPSMHSSTEIITTQPAGLDFVNGTEKFGRNEVNNAAKNAVEHESKRSNISDGCQSTYPTADQRALDDGRVHSAFMPVGHEISSSCQENGPDGCEVVVPITVAKPYLQDRNNTKVTSGCSGDGVSGLHNPQEKSPTADGDAQCVDGVLTSDKPSNHSACESRTDHPILTHLPPESLCNSSSVSGVTHPCASDGANSPSASKVMVLSNKAS